MMDTLARPGGPPLDPHIDRRRLENDLRHRVRGEVRFDAGSRALYATDSSNYRQVPLGVVLPASVEDLAETVRVCAEHHAPVTHRGGGTALAGQTCNTAVIIDSSKYCTRLIRLDPEKRRAVVEPGVVLRYTVALSIGLPLAAEAQVPTGSF
jgi:FAD/FMN-containing dehydrogenase